MRDVIEFITIIIVGLAVIFAAIIFIVEPADLFSLTSVRAFLVVTLASTPYGIILYRERK